MNLLFAIILQVLINPFSIDEPYKDAVEKQETHNEYKIDYAISTQSATDMEWVWCNVCHQHLPEIGGTLYNWDNTTHSITGKHEHQSGYDTPIDSNGKGVYFLILLCAVLCFYNMIYGKKSNYNNEKCS